MEKIHTYFLGGSSPIGFRTPFGEVLSDTSYHTFIIKGGPGTGKSSFMKRIAGAFDKEDRDIYLCSSDPSSVDAVVIKEHKAIIVDGTAPHIFEPNFPGASDEIINFGDCWNGDMLRSQKDEIIAAFGDYSQYHVRCRRYLSAASSVMGDTKHIGEAALDAEKLEGFIKRLAKKLLPPKSAEQGKLFFRQISAVTPEGYISMPIVGDEIYLLNDDYYAGSDHFLRSFADVVRSRGLDCEISVCYLFDGEHFEHLRIPSLGISFITSSPVSKVSVEVKKPINFMRFYKKEIISLKRARLKFNAEASRDLIREAVFSLKYAKRAHDKVEEFYISAVDFRKTDALFEKYADKIRTMNL